MLELDGKAVVYLQGQTWGEGANAGGWLLWRLMNHSLSYSCDTWNSPALAWDLVLDNFVSLDRG